MRRFRGRLSDDAGLITGDVWGQIAENMIEDKLRCHGTIRIPVSASTRAFLADSPRVVCTDGFTILIDSLEEEPGVHRRWTKLKFAGHGMPVR